MNDLQNTTQKTKDRATRNLLKNPVGVGGLGCPGMVRHSGSTNNSSNRLACDIMLFKKFEDTKGVIRIR